VLVAAGTGRPTIDRDHDPREDVWQPRRARVTTMSAHRDLVPEQKYIDRAYECLSAMRARTLRLSDKELAGSADDSALVQDQLIYRLSSLDDDTKPLCFGRIDGDGEIHYIGRRHVKDERDEPVVIDWRAPAATPFYRATMSDPMDLTRRRRFSVKGRQLIDIFDERFDDPDSLLAGAHTVPDPLLAELSRARTGEMRDIVATIQAEQDVIIRTPLNRLVVVQDGPGTGKTAVGLHRAAFLLYEHRRKLERDTVLIIGPNDLLLRYVSKCCRHSGRRPSFRRRSRASSPRNTRSR
jgi:DNA helicase IV